MAEDVTYALGVLEQAAQLERDGREFYLRAARTTQDPKGQDTFRMLADDETNHLNLVERQYNALRNEKKWVELAEVKKEPVDLSQPLFPKGKEAIEKAVTAKSDDLDAVRFGIETEIKSYDLYRQAALRTGDGSGKAMFEFLAGQEKGHFDTLVMRYEYLSGPVGWQS